MIPTPVTSVVMLPKITRRPLRPPPTRPRCSAQGLQWYTSSMRQDADGDMADQFLSESSSVHGAKRSHTGRARELPPLQVLLRRAVPYLHLACHINIFGRHQNVWQSIDLQKMSALLLNR